MRNYSRRVKVEQKRNKKKAAIFLLLTFAILIIFFFFGLPAIVKFAAFLTDLRQSSQVVETSDETPPPPPKFEPIPSATNKSEIDIKGSTEPGATVKLMLNNEEVEVLANKDGEFVYEFSLNEGKNFISATAFDNSGNESARTTEQTIIVDNEPPKLEIIKPEDGSEYFGARERQIVIEGVTDDDATININGRVVVVSSDGSFAFASSLVDGENVFNIKAQDIAENFTEESLTVTYSP